MSKNYHHGDLRHALIEKTLELVQADQVHLVGFRELARQLAVSRSAPYRHFPNVEALLAEVARQGFAAFVDVLEPVATVKEYAPEERFLELGVTYVQFALEHSAHYRLMFDCAYFKQEDFPEVQGLAARAFELLKRTSSACMDKSASDRDKVELATVAWAFVHGLSKLFIDGQLPKIKNQKRFIRSSCQRFVKLAQCANE
ncbi:MAG: TetR/AcrR family transcriptional regulator [Proteobacteria bacterium]|nr:TetR/AcrR family transcriptional regulator [Pseudomonadota bacterium]